MANPTITVTRKDNGLAEYTFTDGSKIITGSGFWDDATPWAAGDYKASYWLFERFSSSFRFGTPTNPDPIPNRKSIVFHRGINTGNTEGCLVDADDFVGRVYEYLRVQDLAPEYPAMLASRVTNDYYNKSWTPIDIKVTDDFSYGVQLSINGGKSSYIEGEDILLEISLTGPGAASGLSKDIWFHLDFSGTGSFKSDLKSNSLASLPSPARSLGLENDNQWIKLSAGQQKVTVALSSIFDDLKEETETFKVTIDNYVIRRESNISGVVFYKSEGSFPINGSNDIINFDLKNQEKIFDKLIESGSQGNFTFTAPVAPKQIITGQFTSYSIPDRLIIKDGNTTLLDTGTVSVTGMPIDFRIPDNSKGNITVTVQAALGGTLWNFSLVSGGFAPRNQRLLNNFSPLLLEEPEPLAVTPEAKSIQPERVDNTYTSSIVSEGEVYLEAKSIQPERVDNTYTSSIVSEGEAYLEAKSIQPERVVNTYTSSIVSEGEAYLEAKSIQPEWVVNTYTSSVLTEGKVYDTGQAIRFSINRNGDTNQTEEIGWRVKPTGDSPISANDFESGTLPEGVLTLLPSVQTTVDIHFEGLDTTGLSQEVLDIIGPINDYWGLKQDGLQEGEETWTIELFAPSTGNIIPASFNGNSVFSVRDDFFFVEPETGTDDGELLEGDNLSNIIFGSGGDDTINGNAGNDTLYGDNGDDIINGGIGDDIIDSGFGNDTIDGGAGNDTLRISRPQSKISLIKQSNSSYLLQDLSDVSLGIDVLKSIETIEFSDGTIQLDTKTEILGTSGRDELTGTLNSDHLIGLQGADKLTGGGGNDQFVYTSIRDRGDTITDFEVGKDNIVFTQLLDSLVAGGYNGTNAIADNYVKVVLGNSASNFSVQIDSDGLAAGDIFRPFITVNLTNPGILDSPSNFAF
ncbi:putative calcium-binding protein (plasmid) [Cylindrospermum stagnale PCC 7417]|uniref:Putative calcium-binding protein n=1 Tax=Cylindrospermum stagnale PCC 7417 TaxID=56107 RepID=K9X755_9NOST|nr:type I secretion C-terminal target domain-containing protein [Cylindrospermum stagnale]AFZ28323.1 putative calcium-binding protein [Cylindrospermum stagnale PCC 7417]